MSSTDPVVESDANQPKKPMIKRSIALGSGSTSDVRKKAIPRKSSSVGARVDASLNAPSSPSSSISSEHSSDASDAPIETPIETTIDEPPVVAVAASPALVQTTSRRSSQSDAVKQALRGVGVKRAREESDDDDHDSYDYSQNGRIVESRRASPTTAPRLNVYYCSDHNNDAVEPSGSVFIIVAHDEDAARVSAVDLLKKHNMPSQFFTLIPVPTTAPSCELIQDDVRKPGLAMSKRRANEYIMRTLDAEGSHDHTLRVFRSESCHHKYNPHYSVAVAVGANEEEVLAKLKTRLRALGAARFDRLAVTEIDITRPSAHMCNAPLQRISSNIVVRSNGYNGAQASKRQRVDEYEPQQDINHAYPIERYSALDTFLY
jgi:hypothetical protein